MHRMNGRPGLAMKKTPFLILLLVSCAFSQTVYIDAGHWLYAFLNRMDQRGLIAHPLIRTIPMTRLEIAEYLLQIPEQRLNSVEQQQLNYLKAEFQEELQKDPGYKAPAPGAISKLTQSRALRWLPDEFYANGRNFLSLASGPVQLYIDPILCRTRLYASADTLQKEERVFENSNGLVIWGSIGAHLGFVSNIRDSREWGTRHYPGTVNFSREGLGFAQGGPDYLEHDETVAYLVANWNHLVLQFGKDKNQWGPGRFGQLAMSTRPTSYDQIKLQYSTSRIRFIFLLAQLQHYTDYTYFYGARKSKILASHRLEIAPWSGFSFSFFETMIHAGKSVEWSYLNPVMFFRSADHYLGDRDNAGMGADFSARLPLRSRIYGECFIDDISTRKLGSGFYANRYAYMLGMDQADLFGLSNFDIALEYTRIRPFTYSHERDIDYRHFTTNLGHWIGPNSELIALGASYRFSQPLSVRLTCGRLRHGDNPPGANIGGNILEPWGDHGSPLNIDLLEGELKKTGYLTLKLDYEPLRNYFFILSYSHYLDHIADATRNEVTFSLRINP